MACAFVNGSAPSSKATRTTGRRVISRATRTFSKAVARDMSHLISSHDAHVVNPSIAHSASRSNSANFKIQPTRHVLMWAQSATNSRPASVSDTDIRLPSWTVFWSDSPSTA
jgi:hypothetical protein